MYSFCEKYNRIANYVLSWLPPFLDSLNSEEKDLKPEDFWKC